MTNEVPTLQDANATLQHAKEKAVDLSIQYGPKMVAALLIMVVGFFAARWVGNLVQRWLAKIELEPPVRSLLLRVVRSLVFIIFLLMAVQQLGFELTPILAMAGVMGAGIAFAMQGVLGNLFAGLTIIFTKPFKVGE